jgi:NADH:ubiquinone oxidoreductase subunit H
MTRMSMHHDCRIIIVFCAPTCFSHLYSNKKKLVNNVMYCYVRNALPRVRLVSLVKLCYVFLLPCYLGGIEIVQPFLQKKNVVCFLMKRPPPKQP